MKRIFSLLLLSMLGIAMAQNNSTSPYSAYGLGDIVFDNSPELGGMANIGTIATNPFGASANFSNPAANKDLNLTSFDFDIRTDMNRMKSGDQTAENSATYISSVSIAFPIGSKSKLGFGFQPYSMSSYGVTSSGTNDGLDYTSNFQGSGGLNSLHAMFARNITKDLSIGVRLGYLFGQIKHDELLYVDGADLFTVYSTDSKTSGLQVVVGGLYNKKLDGQKNLTFGATYTLGTNLNSDIKQLTVNTGFYESNTSNSDTISYRRFDQSTKIPQQLTLAASYSKNLSWMVGTQLEFTKWADTDIYNIDNGRYSNQWRWAAGGYWIPNFNSYRSYFARVTYRGGLFFERTPLQIMTDDGNYHGISKYGATIGAGFPIGKQRDASELNISFELGRRGSTDFGMVQETYGVLKVGFTINDFWFRKRVID